MGRAYPLILLLACLVAASGASAVVHTTGDGSGNTTPPPDDPGFANVGRSVSGGNSGVYLGNRWVLTAAHVGEGSFVFGGVTYDPVVGSFVRLLDGGTMTDLAMIKLMNPAPPLPDLVLSTATPGVGDVVTLIGNGWSRQAALTCWTGAWAEVACPGGVFEGYKRQGPRTLRWGLNMISAIGTDVTIGNVTTRAFDTTFDEAGVSDEAQIVGGDSGGAAFLKRGATWELVGIHIAMAVFGGQPFETAVFGDVGFSGDVFYYKTQIEEILPLPPPAVPVAPWPVLLLGSAVLLAVARRALHRDLLPKVR